MIWAGDFNSRLETEQYKLKGDSANKQFTFQMMKAGDYEALSKNDQFTQDLNKHDPEHEYKEGPIHNFTPTFKLRSLRQEFNMKRNPSWTDRIIYKGEHLELMNYDSNNLLRATDHRPVFAQLELTLNYDKEDMPGTKLSRNISDLGQQRTETCNIF